MAYTGNLLKKVYPILEKMGEGVYFETMHDALNFQAETNEQARVIRSFFPGCKWERSYNEVMKWWTWDTNWDGIKIHIYALR